MLRESVMCGMMRSAGPRACCNTGSSSGARNPVDAAATESWASARAGVAAELVAATITIIAKNERNLI